MRLKVSLAHRVLVGLILFHWILIMVRIRFWSQKILIKLIGGDLDMLRPIKMPLKLSRANHGLLRLNRDDVENRKHPWCLKDK